MEHEDFSLLYDKVHKLELLTSQVVSQFNNINARDNVSDKHNYQLQKLTTYINS